MTSSHSVYRAPTSTDTDSNVELLAAVQIGKMDVSVCVPAGAGVSMRDASVDDCVFKTY